MSNNEAFACAVERAKQVATKITDEPQSNSGFAGMKRAAEDNGHYASEKRPFMNEKSIAAATAAEAVARINQKFIGNSQVNNIPGNNIITVNWSIPDKYVGLIIGKNGQQIKSLQNDSCCRVDIAHETGHDERPLTLIGTTQQIEAAKNIVKDIIARAERSGGPVVPSMPGTGPENHISIELNVPGDKAGLIIGKGGETIKRLQEENNVKMVLIQQNNQASLEDKPLKISGEAQHVERVKQIVSELINSLTARGPGKPMPSEGQEMTKYAVPAEKAGLVIGKGGESIKEICRVTNAHVEISKEVAPDPAIKIFNIRGGSSEIEHAIRLISDRAGIQMTRPTSAVNAQAGYGYGYMADPNSAYGAPAASNGSMPTPTFNPYTGQPDYSAAWIEYYRRLGMHENADAIQRQAQQQHAAASAMPVGAGAPQPAPVAAAAAPVAVTTQAQAAGMGSPAGFPGAVAGSQPQAAGQVDYTQWQQWQQWQASQWQAWQQPGAGGVPGGAAGQGARQPSAVEQP